MKQLACWHYDDVVAVGGDDICLADVHMVISTAQRCDDATFERYEHDMKCAPLASEFDGDKNDGSNNFLLAM